MEMEDKVRRLGYVLMPISLFLLWTWLTEGLKVQPFLIPSPSLVGKVIWDERVELARQTLITLSVGSLGYLIANIIALTLSISFLYLPALEEFLNPWFVLITRIPWVTFSPILIITMGDTPVPKIIIVVLVTFFTILANLLEGLKSVDQVLLDRLQTLNANRWQVFWKARWPAAAPYFMAAQVIAFTNMIIAIIVAEYQFANDGLGFVIVRSMQQYRTDKLYAVALIASVLNVAIYILIKEYQTRKFRYLEAT